MPKVTVWIRAEDYDKWCSISSKPEWLHSKLKDVDKATEVLKGPSTKVVYTQDWGA